jgi:hypothetical protein
MNKLVGLLPSRPSTERRVTTDFAAVAKFRTQDEDTGPKLKFVSSTKSEIIKKQPSLQSMTDIQEALPIIEILSAIENQSAILRDSINRGMIFL